MIHRCIRRRPAVTDAAWPDALHPVLRRVYAARGVTPDRARLALADLAPPDALPGLGHAVRLLHQAVEQDRHIVVVGDFDCDGATGTAVAVRGLRLLGARSVDFRVPHRMRHGYGLSAELVADLGAGSGDREPDLLLTVDSGVACHAGVAAARARGMQVIVTDHHLPGATLPDADALVNPCLQGSGFPSPALAGVGVVFYLLLALRRHRREHGCFAGAEPDLSCLLDLVALGTVADMVPLDHNNRILVAAGLRRLRQRRCQPGLRALAEVAGRALETLSCADLGFALGPRLNAAGRLDDMRVGIACLLADDPQQARVLAERLHAINGERRELQRDMLEQAEQHVAALLERDTGSVPAAVCVYDPQWHAGIVGLIASRLKDRLHRPVAALAPGGEDGLLRGSVRSIPGLHVRDVLADVAAGHPGLIARFGGHGMAAGLSLDPRHVDVFATAFAIAAEARLDPALLVQEILSDGELGPGDFGRPLADALRYGGPWGQGFPEPLFDGEFSVLEWRCVGSDHLRMRLQPLAGGPALVAIQFGGWSGAPPPRQLRAAYQLEPDDWRGDNGIQLLVRHLEVA